MTGKIEHVTDSAFWLASLRALESERPDALFHDPGLHDARAAPSLTGRAEIHKPAHHAPFDPQQRNSSQQPAPAPSFPGGGAANTTRLSRCRAIGTA
jgi:hypothetical protein